MAIVPILVLVALVVFVIAVATRDEAADELARLSGWWMVVAAEQGGRPLDAIRGGSLVLSGSTFYLRTAAGNEFRGDIRVDPSPTPPNLDFLHDTGAAWHAIYRQDEATLWLNYVVAGDRAPRPVQFATAPNAPDTLIVLTRMAVHG